jgi:hypothetical protein
VKKGEGPNIVCRQRSQREKAVNYRTRIYKVNFISHLLCPQQHKNFLKGISDKEKELGGAQMFKHPPIWRLFYLRGNTITEVQRLSRANAALEETGKPDFLGLTNQLSN